MQPSPPLTNEQLNNLPLLLGIIEQMGIREQVDACLTPHGAWQGASVGTLVSLWLAYLLSQRAHRLVAVRDWVASRKETLQALLGVGLRDTDCTDDRLANVLFMLGKAGVQEAIDDVLISQWLRVYRLPTSTLRLDSTSVSVYHEPTRPESLLQLGHSKDHRPDLAQFKAMLGSLDPLGMPVCMQMVAGNTPDDGLYLPAYHTVVQRLGTADLLVVGDSKMAALATRAQIVSGGSTYLCPYRPGGNKPELDAWIARALAWRGQWQLFWGGGDPSATEAEGSAQVVEWKREQTWTCLQTGQTTTWEERVLLVQSKRYHAGQCQLWQRRLARLVEQVQQLRAEPKRGRKRSLQPEPVRALLEDMIQKSGLLGLVSIKPQEQTCADGSRRWIAGEGEGDACAWEAQMARLGWQVYVSNTPANTYPTLHLVRVYHQQVLQERGFARLKTRTLHLRPVYLRDETRLGGLLWLLCLALRVLTLTEYRLRRALEDKQEVLYGLNPASRNQGTQIPTTERVLAVFENLTWTAWQSPEGRQSYVTELNHTQRQVLQLLDLPEDLYQRLATNGTNLPLILRE